MKRNKINIKMKIRNSCPICRNKKIVTTFKYKNTPLEDNFVTKKEKSLNKNFSVSTNALQKMWPCFFKAYREPKRKLSLLPL